jgi:hypothetical protein
VTVELQILPVTHQGRVQLSNAAKSGTAVEARVVATHEDGTARLSVSGQTIDVSTPYALQAGTNISVSVVREGANLKLVLQQDAPAVPQQPAAPSTAMLGDDAALLLSATARAAVISALLESSLSSQAKGAGQTATAGQTGTQAQSPSTAAPPAGAAPGPQPQAAVQTQPGLAAPPQTPGPAGGLPGTGPQSAVQARQAPEPLQQTPASTGSLPAAPAAPQTAAQSSTQVFFVPVLFPQMAEPLMLRIEQQQEEEDSAGDGTGQEDKRAWTVSVSIDAGTLGLVQIGIGLRQGAVSVRLSAGDVQGVAHLSTWLPELKSSLEQADFVTGELSAVRVRVADAAGQDQSHTV